MMKQMKRVLQSIEAKRTCLIAKQKCQEGEKRALYGTKNSNEI